MSILCILIKVLSHTNAKKKTERLKDSNFALLLVVLKWYHGSESVNTAKRHHLLNEVDHEATNLTI